MFDIICNEFVPLSLEIIIIFYKYTRSRLKDTKEVLVFGLKMKGEAKRRTHFFKKGNLCASKSYQIKSVSSQQPMPSTSSLADHQPRDKAPPVNTAIPQRASNSTSSSDTLRHSPRKQPVKQEHYSSGNRILSISEVFKMMNSVYIDHQQLSKCNSLHVVVDDETKNGLGWSYKVACKNCNFVSKTYDLFERCKLEGDRKPIHGPQAAVLNVSLAMALTDVSIGIQAFRYICCCLDIPPATKTNMHRHMCNTSDSIKQLNETDMTKKLQLASQQNNSDDPSGLTVAGDGKYQSRGKVAYNRPGQNASQAYMAFKELHTANKYIIGLVVENKLCWTGAFLKARGFDVKCPEGHEGCTSNLRRVEAFSERRMAMVFAERLYIQDYWISAITTDGDTKACLGINDFYQSLEKHFFAKKGRCSLILNKLFDEHGRAEDGIERIVQKLPDILHTTVECYAGNCSNCCEHSMVCSGEDDAQTWWEKSFYLLPAGIQHLKMTENDKLIMLELLEIRLSEVAIKKIQTGHSTQSVESFNRSTTASMPKELNYSRNFEGRLHSAAHRSNNTIGESLKEKLRHLTNTQLSENVVTQLDGITRESLRHRELQKSPDGKKRKLDKIKRNEYEYHAYHMNRKNVDNEDDVGKDNSCDDLGDYNKGQMDKDHKYAATFQPTKRTRK